MSDDRQAHNCGFKAATILDLRSAYQSELWFKLMERVWLYVKPSTAAQIHLLLSGNNLTTVGDNSG